MNLRDVVPDNFRVGAHRKQYLCVTGFDRYVVPGVLGERRQKLLKLEDLR